MSYLMSVIHAAFYTKASNIDASAHMWCLFSTVLTTAQSDRNSALPCPFYMGVKHVLLDYLKMECVCEKDAQETEENRLINK